MNISYTYIYTLAIRGKRNKNFCDHSFAWIMKALNVFFLLFFKGLCRWDFYPRRKGRPKFSMIFSRFEFGITGNSAVITFNYGFSRAAPTSARLEFAGSVSFWEINLRRRHHFCLILKKKCQKNKISKLWELLN